MEIIENNTMFSTPQSKAFFSQEMVKYKLICDETEIIESLHSKSEQFKEIISKVNMMLSTNKDNESFDEEAMSIAKANDLINETIDEVADSNEIFEFEVNLRDELKTLEQLFFKDIMNLYEEKIKELKSSLLRIEDDVQDLEQKGYLPYVNDLQTNTILSSKIQNCVPFIEKWGIVEKIISFSKKGNLEELMISLVNSLLKKNTLNDNNSKIEQKEENTIKFEQPFCVLKEELNISHMQQTSKEQARNSEQETETNNPLNIIEMLKILEKWEQVKQISLKKMNREMKTKIEGLNETNKAFKQSIKNVKKILKHEEKEAQVRCGDIQFSFDDVGNFLYEMSKDFYEKMNNRNDYLLTPIETRLNQSKSCPNFHTKTEELETAHYLRELSPNLNDSFMEKCNYLISDRFIELETNEEIEKIYII